jgi:hypothetical protein
VALFLHSFFLLVFFYSIRRDGIIAQGRKTQKEEMKSCGPFVPWWMGMASLSVSIYKSKLRCHEMKRSIEKMYVSPGHDTGFASRKISRGQRKRL